MLSAQVVSKDDTPTGSVYKSKRDSMLKCVFSRRLCLYDLRKSDLFVLSLVRVRRVCMECFLCGVYI